MVKPKYGFHMRFQPPDREPAGPFNVYAPGFGDSDDEDETDTNKAIDRDAKQKKYHKGIEDQKKKAIEEDPFVFEFDGIYDQMKEQAVRPTVQDQQERKPKYMDRLMEYANERKRRREIIHEEKLAKEMSKDEHIYADKLKFVTDSYKNDLAIREKLKEQDRLQELREEKEGITEMSMMDFYANVSNNKAFGAKATEKTNTKSSAKQSISKTSSPLNSEAKRVRHHSGTPAHNENTVYLSDLNSKMSSSEQGHSLEEKPSADQIEQDYHKKNEDVLAAAQERYIARKRAKK